MSGYISDWDKEEMDSSRNRKILKNDKFGQSSESSSATSDNDDDNDEGSSGELNKVKREQKKRRLVPEHTDHLKIDRFYSKKCKITPNPPICHGEHGDEIHVLIGNDDELVAQNLPKYHVGSLKIDKTNCSGKIQMNPSEIDSNKANEELLRLKRKIQNLETNLERQAEEVQDLKQHIQSLDDVASTGEPKLRTENEIHVVIDKSDIQLLDIQQKIQKLEEKEDLRVNDLRRYITQQTYHLRISMDLVDQQNQVLKDLLGQKMPAFDKLDNIMRTYTRELEETNERNVTSKRKEKSELVRRVRLVPRKRTECVFCGALDHPSIQCNEYTTCRQRRLKLTRDNICLRCLKPDYELGLIHKCHYENKYCRDCRGERHHPILCPGKIGDL